LGTSVTAGHWHETNGREIRVKGGASPKNTLTKAADASGNVVTKKMSLLPQDIDRATNRREIRISGGTFISDGALDATGSEYGNNDMKE